MAVDIEGSVNNQYKKTDATITTLASQGIQNSENLDILEDVSAMPFYIADAFQYFMYRDIIIDKFSDSSTCSFFVFATCYGKQFGIFLQLTKIAVLGVQYTHLLKF